MDKQVGVRKASFGLTFLNFLQSKDDPLVCTQHNFCSTIHDDLGRLRMAVHKLPILECKLPRGKLEAIYVYKGKASCIDALFLNKLNNVSRAIQSL